MGKRFTRFLVLAACLLLVSGAAFAQMTTTGRLIGTVTDPTGAVVIGADVKVTDEATGKAFETKSGNDGGFVFSALQPGSYTVTVTMQGFKKSEVRAVKIVVGGQHGLTVQLELGEMASTVVIEAGTEVLQTSETKVGTTIMGKSITQLPFTSRDTLDLAVLMAGAQTVGRPRETTFMGLPQGTINVTLDGIANNDQLLKSSDGFFTMVRPRIDTIEEFSISTAAGSAGESGEGAVQIRFETKRGTSDYHGGAWWYHRNDKFNSNYWFSNLAGTTKQRQRLNQFGAKVGGPIIKEKLFFFTALDFYRNPESRLRTRTILTDEGFAGVFRYSTGSTSVTPTATQAQWTTCGATVTPGTTGFECAVNLIRLAQLSSPFLPPPYTGTVLPSGLDTYTAYLNGLIQSAVTAPGVSPGGAQPTRYQRLIAFNNGGGGRRNFPDFRFDYNMNKNHSITAIYHYNFFAGFPDFLNSRDAIYPVAPLNTSQGGQYSNRNSTVAAWRWNMGTTRTNEVRVGLMSAPTVFSPDLPIDLYPTGVTALGPIGIRYSPSGSTAPMQGYTGSGRNGAVLQLIDTFSWTRGKHNFTFGGSWTEVIYKSYGSSAKVGTLSTGLVGDDLAVRSAFGSTFFPGSSSTDRTNAMALYASLVGRVSGFTGSIFLNPDTRQFEQGFLNLQRTGQSELGIYGTDNWRLFSTLTMNLGVRWELQQAPRDKLNRMFRLDGDVDQGIAGRSCTIDSLFTPGSATCATPLYVLNGEQKWYKNDFNNFAPSAGLAWTPNFEGNLFKWIFGGPGKSVFRVGYSISFTREGLNNFFSIAGSNPGGSSSLATTASASVGSGFFTPGAITVAQAVGGTMIPNIKASPPAFVSSFAIDPAAGQSANVFDPNLGIPYVQSWQAGWQREVTPTTVIEVRYVGNHGTGLWRQFDLNETNIFENGFLTEFNNAKNNLEICRANRVACTGSATGALRYDNRGVAGQVNLPIFTAAFGTAPAFTDSTFITNLDLGVAGTVAGALNSYTRWNNLVAAGYPANFWMLNPDARGGSYLFGNQTHTNYHGLQIEFRRKPSKGLQYNANYTFSKSLSNFFADSDVSYAGFSTIRDPGHDKGPSPYDLRHAFKMQLIYEMPFGPGKKFSSSQGWLNRIIEGWEINTITRWQSGRITPFSGGLGGTVNGTDGGVELIGITASQIQEMLAIRKTPDGKVYWFPDSLIGADGKANPAFIKACSTPGEFCQRLFLHGPSFFRADWSLGKRTKLTEKANIEFRAEFLNAFNTANFFYGGSAAGITGTAGLQSTSFGRIFDAYQDTSTTDDPGGRIIQMVLRINF